MQIQGINLSMNFVVLSVTKNTEMVLGNKKVENHWSRVLPFVNREFKILFVQLSHYKPNNAYELSLLKAKLNELAHSFCGSPIDVNE